MANLCVFLPVLRANYRSDFACLPVCSIFICIGNILEDAHDFLLSFCLAPTPPLSSACIGRLYLLQIRKTTEVRRCDSRRGKGGGLEPNRDRKKGGPFSNIFPLKILGKGRQKSLRSLYAKQGKRLREYHQRLKIEQTQFKLLTYLSVYFF
jgi:hypothetical protein